ncbi:two-component regulator propeller domain-containing protein [Polaribacter undariae]|uniref:histidine kinase n=1 Tax=Polaribacter sejongensis TaxID=985043 RepID=A0AAJ1VGY4_9FLAO|nr:two-component regulator propeller domain-containing protein [Polaribacter undariae]MDN3620096.1 two-component regulator propeller domain-containing protein [Polaribacter undariae]UWD32243.1 response regulator [Polaribacter undariae]
MKNIYFYFLLFIISFSSNAQKLDLKFNTVEYNDNFPQSNISVITQSKRGFIWMGTDNGLLRYDGYNFIRYYTKNREDGTISDNKINTIYEDVNENLWVGTNHGVNLYNRNTNDFKIIDILKTKGGRNYISSFVEDDQNNLWVGTFGGVRKIDKENHLLKDVFKTTNPSLSNSKVYSLFYDKEHGVLVGTNAGLKSFNPETGFPIELPLSIKENKLFHQNRILKIVKDHQGDLWFATERAGVYMFSKRSNKFIAIKHLESDKNTISSNNVKDILSIDTNTIWFATDNGLNVFKKDTQEFFSYQHNQIIASTISDNNITSLLKDRENSVWLGTKIGSINFYNECNSNFVNINESIEGEFGLNNSIVNALASDVDGSLWAGTNGGGLNHLNFKTSVRKSYFINSFNGNGANVINSVENKNENTLLCGTLIGLFEFNKKKKTFRKITINDKDVQVTSLAVDNETIWVGTDGNGLIEVSKNGDIKNYIKDTSKNSISDNFIIDINKVEEGLWISTQFGLDFYNKNTSTFTTYFKSEKAYSLPNNTLTTVFTDSKNRLWIGLGYGGLTYFDKNNNKFYLIDEGLGLTDDTIKSIAEDNDGNLWVSSNNLLFKIKFNEFSVPFIKSNLEILSYGTKNGITVKSYSINCSENIDNKIAFGGGKGFVLFDPNTIKKTKKESEIVLTKLMVNNEEVKFSIDNPILKKDISEASEITVNHNQKFIGLQFSSLNFIHTEKNNYAYKLESTFDKGDWQNIGTQNNINLAALEAGTYVLKLKSLHQEGLENPTLVKSLKIKILPPWWQTNLAYFLYLLLLLSIIFLIMNFIRSKMYIKQALVLKQTESIRQKELYNMKLDFFTNISHEIRTPLTLIKGPVEELLELNKEDEKNYKKLLNIKKNSERLLNLINELLDFRKIESKQAKLFCEEKDIVQFCFDIFESFKGLAVKKNIDYKFVMNSKAIPLLFDTYQMEKVIYNLLGNAFKFTKKNGKIVLSIEEVAEDNNWVEIKIKDNGIGIPKGSKTNVFKSFFQLNERGYKNVGSGIGLALSKTIVELHLGKLTIENEDSSWTNTVFKISLQKGKEHLKTPYAIENKITIDDPVSIIPTIETPISQIIQNNNGSHEQENFENDTSKKTLLIIDDERDIRQFITDILQEEYHIIDFSKAQDALDYMVKEIPDLIICDVMMPEMDGFEFCKHIKTSEGTNHIPIILLTAKASTQSRIEGLTIGADAYISKPFSIKVLKLNIINLLSSKEILRQKFSGSFIIDSKLDKIDDPDELFIKKLMKLIEQNIENPEFDVNGLVSEIGMSRTVLYKKVKALTNHSVASLIKYLRLKKASEILIKTNCNVSEVTYLVGFNDRKHFSKEFKKVFEVSPSEYRKKMLEK